MPEAPPTVDAFVSYSHQDTARVRAVVEAAGALGRTFWLDTSDLQPGTAWPDELRRALETADAVVCMLSAAWLASGECRREYETGIELGKRIVPVLLDELSYDALPPSMRSVQWVDSRGLDADAVADRVVTAIDLDIDRVREHTLWLGRALRWDGTGRERSQLPRGRELREAERFLSDAGVDPAPVAVQREYVAAGRVAERRRQRLLLGSVTTAFVVALVLSLVSLHLRGVADEQRARAEKERDAAVARSLVEQSRTLAVTDPVLARQSALAAWRIQPDDDTRLALLQSATNRALRVFDTESPPAFAVAISPDGRTLAAGGADGVIHLWDVASGRPATPVLRGKEYPVRHLAWSPDGSLLASASDAWVQVWDPETGREAAGPFVGGPDFGDGRGNFVWQFAFDPDGRRIAVVDTDGYLTEFDVTTDLQVGDHLMRSPKPLTSVAYTPDGRTLVVTGDDDLVRFFDVSTRRLVRPTVRIGDGANPQLALTHGGTVLAVGQGDGKVGFWRTADHSKVTELVASTAPIHALAFSADDDVLATSSDEPQVRLWDTHTVRPWGQQLSAPAAAVWSLDFAPTGRSLATGGSDGVARLWDLEIEGARGSPMAAGDADANAVAVSVDGRRVVVGGVGTAATEWDTETQLQLLHLDLGTNGSVSTLDVSPDGHYVAAGTTEGGIYLWDLATGALVAQSTLPLPGAVRVIAFTIDGQSIVTASGDSLDTLLDQSADYGIRRWEVPGLHQESLEITQSATVKDMALTPDGRHALTTTGDQLQLLDLATLAVTAQRTVGTGLSPVAVSPDGRRVAVATATGIQLLRLDGLEPDGRALTGPMQSVTALAFSPDSRTLVSGSLDNTLQLWDLATRATIGQPFVGHVGNVDDVDFAPDGSYVASAGDDSGRLWDASFLADPAASVCDQVGRPLTRPEWAGLTGSDVPYQRTC